MRKTLFFLIFLAFICAGGVAFLGAKNLPGPLLAPKIVWIQAGSGTLGIADQLAAEGALSAPLLFVAHAYLTPARASLKAGEYELPLRASIADILSILRSGKTHARKLTIPEGLTSAEIVEIVRTTPYLSGPLPTPIPAEGTLLPETYLFSRGMSRAAFLSRMQKDMQTLIDTSWRARTPDPLIDTPEKWVTLASIVEKETGKPEERPHVAAVFLSRLKIGMKLQSDPTVIYAMTKGAGKLDRPLTRADLDQTLSPYNTYLNGGLPPGPIANPGRASLTAVLSPLPSDDLYFVADGTGGHAFAKTLAAHNKNVAAWRTMQKTP